MPEPMVLSYEPSTALRAQHKIGNSMLVSLGLLFLAGIPALYAAGKIDITTVNQLGRFLAVVIAAIGLDLVWGYAGILGLCQAMFFCLGGYAIGMYLALHGPLDGDGIPRCLFVVTSEVSGFKLPWFWVPFKTLPVALILGVLIPGVFAYLFGFFTFRSRVRGVYFSIITQATTLVGLHVFRMNNMRLCGTNGLTNFVTLAGYDLGSPNVKLGLYCLTVVALILTYLVGLWVVRSRLGRLLVAVRDNESRLRFAGYQPVNFKMFVFALGAMMAALGGMLYTPQNGIITPAKMEAIESILIVAAVAVGGRGTLSGAVVGSLVVSYLQSLLTSGVFYGWLPAFLKIQEGVAQVGFMGAIRRALRNVLGAEGWLLILGLVFIVITLFMPEGIVGTWRRFLAWCFRKKTTGSDELLSSPAIPSRAIKPAQVEAPV